ncbi:MAG: hypothetical protein ABH814_02890 [bacterium]
MREKKRDLKEGAVESKRNQFWFGLVLLVAGAALILGFAPLIRVEDPSTYADLGRIFTTDVWYALILVLGLVCMTVGLVALFESVISLIEGDQICLLDKVPWVVLEGSTAQVDRAEFLFPSHCGGLFESLKRLGVHLKFLGPCGSLPESIEICRRGAELDTICVSGNESWKAKLLEKLDSVDIELTR